MKLREKVGPLLGNKSFLSLGYALAVSSNLEEYEELTSEGVLYLGIDPC